MVAKLAIVKKPLSIMGNCMGCDRPLDLISVSYQQQMGNIGCFPRIDSIDLLMTLDEMTYYRLIVL